MASPTTVTYAVREPDTSARAGVPVTARLVGAGDRSDTPGVVLGVIPTTTAADGSFSLSLLPNSAYQQAGTYYLVKISGGAEYAVVVPVSVSAVDLWDIRVDPRTLEPVPAATPPIYITRAELGAAGGAASLDPVTGKVPTSQLPAAAGAVLSVNEIDPDVDGDVTLTAGDVGADTAGAAAAAVSGHEGAVNPHSQYLTPAEGDVAYDAAGTAGTLMSAHNGAADPHAQYLTAAEGASAFDAAGTAAAAVAAHKIESDAHGISVITGLQTALDGKATKAKFARLTKTDGNIQLNTGTNTWGLLSGSPTLSIAAAAGDLIELTTQALRQANANIYLDWCVIVSAAVARYMATLTSTPAGEGSPVLYHSNLPAAGGVWKWLAEAGDISGGNITVGFAIRNTSGASSLLLASTDNPLQLALENRGAPS